MIDTSSSMKKTNSLLYSDFLHLSHFHNNDLVCKMNAYQRVKSQRNAFGK